MGKTAGMKGLKWTGWPTPFYNKQQESQRFFFLPLFYRSKETFNQRNTLRCGQTGRRANKTEKDRTKKWTGKKSQRRYRQQLYKSSSWMSKATEEEEKEEATAPYDQSVVRAQIWPGQTARMPLSLHRRTANKTFRALSHSTRRRRWCDYLKAQPNLVSIPPAQTFNLISEDCGKNGQTHLPARVKRLYTIVGVNLYH